MTADLVMATACAVCAIALLVGGEPWAAAVFGLAATFCLGEHIGGRR